MNWKSLNITKSGHKKLRLHKEKMIKKIDEESLQIYGVVKKATEKVMNQIRNFEELEREISWNINQQKIRDNLSHALKLNKFDFLKKEVEEFGQKSKKFESWKQKTKHKAEILIDLNDVCECIIALYSFSISNEKIHQVMPVVLSKLSKKDIERFWSAGVKARLVNARSLSYLKWYNEKYLILFMSYSQIVFIFLLIHF